MGKDNKRLQWFITWPRTDYSKVHFMEDFNKKFRPSEVYCAQETHEEKKEGMPDTHLHLVMKLPFDGGVNKKTLLAWCREKYGDYEAQRIDVKGIRNWRSDKDKVLNYIAKEDGTPVQTKNLEEVETLPISKTIEEIKQENLEFYWCSLKQQILDAHRSGCRRSLGHLENCRCDEARRVREILDSFPWPECTMCNIRYEFEKFLQKNGFQNSIN